MPEKTIANFKKIVKRECSPSLDHIYFRLWNVSIPFNSSFKEAVNKELFQLVFVPTI